MKNHKNRKNMLSNSEIKKLAKLYYFSVIIEKNCQGFWFTFQPVLYRNCSLIISVSKASRTLISEKSLTHYLNALRHVIYGEIHG
ncbi:MAG: hypothetical protein ACRD5H_18515 [Nitrososphaerales archaeon]